MFSLAVKTVATFFRGNNDGNGNNITITNHRHNDDETDAASAAASVNVASTNDDDDDTSPAPLLSASIDSSPVADAKKSSSTHDDINNNFITTTSTTTHPPPSPSNDAPNNNKGSRAQSRAQSKKAPLQQKRSSLQRNAKDHTLAKQLGEEEKRSKISGSGSRSITVSLSQPRQQQKSTANISTPDFNIKTIKVLDLTKEYVKTLNGDYLHAILRKFKPADDYEHCDVYEMKSIIAKIYNDAKSKSLLGVTSTQHSGGGRAKGKKVMKSAVVAVATRKSDRNSKGGKRKATEMDDDSGDEVDVGKKKKGDSKDYSREFWEREKKKQAVATATGGNEDDEDEEEESTNNFPQYLQNVEIDGELVSGFTEIDIMTLSMNTVRSLDQKQIMACLKVIGGRVRNSYGIEALRDELIKWKEMGYSKFVATLSVYLLFLCDDITNKYI